MLEPFLKQKIEILTASANECMKLGTKIHEQLRGNVDYLNDNIILNCTEGDNVVRVYIFKDCENVPVITI